ncbi:hypothetical protein MED297_07756 [Reinekea sp. MED297]|uniref:Uncharacterized protein n=2 Tax=Reinekea TaxID=230494 RepID=A4BCN4_9GAMM|nr:hypothetical protein MED297_07756 [Reinekea sp. MED297] [Reinekea blandensis MED297]
MAVDRGDVISPEQALSLLNRSALVQTLTQSLVDKPLFYVWRLIALSELPFARQLPYTQALIDRVYDRLATPFGFSLSGDRSQFLPCYNAMIITALCRLGEANTDAVRQGVEWIITHQPMKRGVPVSAPGFRFDRFGGCFNDSPCYIGLAKSVFALLHYQRATGDASVQEKLNEGTEYLLNHHLIYRLSTPTPITNHILDLSFPESYHLNAVELIRFVALANRMHDSRTEPLKQALLTKKNNDHGWYCNFRYRGDGYVPFDQGRKSGAWVTYVIQQALASSLVNDGSASHAH